jgi:hypothetical protein
MNTTFFAYLTITLVLFVGFSKFISWTFDKLEEKQYRDFIKRIDRFRRGDH